MSRNTIEVLAKINDDLPKVFTWNNTNRLYDVDPFFMFVVPRVDEFKFGTTRLSDIRIFSNALSDSDLTSLISGYQPQ